MTRKEDLRRRFGKLVAIHRRAAGFTQERLAEAADVSIDTIAKIETGVTGTSFPMIERLAQTLKVDPAEFFTTQIPSGKIQRGAFSDISIRLASLAEPDLDWVKNLIEAALLSRRDMDVPKAKPPTRKGRLVSFKSKRVKKGRPT